MENTINEDRKWTVLSSEYLIRRPWLTARRDVARLPDGRINNEYYVLEYPDWVNVIAITKDGQVVLERQYRHGLGKTCYELPCGVIEAGETPLEAAKRELLEETGYASEEWRHLLTVPAQPTIADNYAYIFEARNCHPVSSQHLDETEFLNAVVLTREELESRIQDGRFPQPIHILGYLLSKR